MYKNIYIDLDGTLLDDQGQVSEDNKYMLKKALGMGSKVYFVSGRPYCFVKDLAMKCDSEIGVVAANGGVIETDDRIITKLIDEDVLKKVIDIISKYKGVHAFFKGMKNFYTSDPYDDRFLYSHYNAQYDTSIQVTSFSDMSYPQLKENACEIIKVLVYTMDKLQLKALRERLEEVEGLTLTSYNEISFDINATGVSKGSALRELHRLHNIHKKETMAIGDAENDISMFEESGLCVAMENATAEIKKRCDAHTLSNNDSGVAHAIWKYNKR